jgi:hypothetical protein
MGVGQPVRGSSHFTKIGVAVFVLVAAFAFPACDDEGPSAAMAFVPTASSTLPAITASINPGIIPGPVGFACPGGPIASNFQIAISASQTVDLDQVSIQMIDGSHLGGPMVTFPSPLLTSQFISRRILAGTTRTFTFNPRFVCGATRPQAVSAQINYVGPTGVMQGITIEQPL